MESNHGMELAICTQTVKSLKVNSRLVAIIPTHYEKLALSFWESKIQVVEHNNDMIFVRRILLLYWQYSENCSLRELCILITGIGRLRQCEYEFILLSSFSFLPSCFAEVQFVTSKRTTLRVKKLS